MGSVGASRAGEPAAARTARRSRLPERWRAELGAVDADTVLLMARLALLSRKVGEAYQEDLRSFGLTYTEYAVLHSLRIEGPPYRLSPSELNRVLALSSGGITKTVDRLESAGLVVRGPDPRDGRGVQVELTPSGRKRAARVFDRGLTKYSEKFAHFDRAKLSRVVDSLGAILAAFEDARPSRPSQPESSD